MTEHKIVENGISPHNGEYWYKCSVCGKSDWIASYGTKNQLNFYSSPCIPKQSPEWNYAEDYRQHGGYDGWSTK